MILELNYHLPRGSHFTEYAESKGEDKYIMSVIREVLKRGAENVVITKTTAEKMRSEVFGEALDIGREEGSNEEAERLLVELKSMTDDEREEYIREEIKAQGLEPTPEEQKEIEESEAQYNAMQEIADSWAAKRAVLEQKYRDKPLN